MCLEVNLSFRITLNYFYSVGTFDSVGSTELENAGKAGLVTIQGKISTVLGTILVCKSFFPRFLYYYFLCSYWFFFNENFQVHIYSLPSSLTKQRSYSNWPLQAKPNKSIVVFLDFVLPHSLCIYACSIIKERVIRIEGKKHEMWIK